MVTGQDPVDELRARIDSHLEWLLVRENGRTFPLRRTEIDIHRVSDKVMFGIFDDSGSDLSRLVSFAGDDDGLHIELCGRFGSAGERIRLIPRTPARELIELARLQRANLIGNAIIEAYPDLKLTRIALNVDNGRLAQILVRDPVGKETAIMADVTGSMVHESIMTTAVLWSEKLRRRKRPIGEVWIAVEKKQARELQRLMALLAPGILSRFRLFELSGSEKPRLKERRRRTPALLFRERPNKVRLPARFEPGDLTSRILELAPGKTDVIFSQHGETVRFLGLPFARVRSIAGVERAWFGIDRKRRLLTENCWNDLIHLVNELDLYRSAVTPNRRHEYYRIAREAWLESILRRNIALLDTNLILSPIYNQFRAASDKIDLLAIRRDGRLVIIELKTSPDREMPYQAADYWRKIELQRRSGELTRIRAFGDMSILDRPALVYAVAPALSFHVDFGMFVQTLNSEIEMWRFDLHEDWRNEVKVLARRDYPSLTNL